MSQYQIIRTIRHDDILSPLFMDENYFLNMKDKLNIDFENKAWMFLESCDIYPSLYSKKAYVDKFGNKPISIFTLAEPFSISYIPESDYGYALVEVKTDSTSKIIQDKRIKNAQFRFIREIQEPAIDYYFTYKINQDQYDTFSVPHANNILFDFVYRKFSEEEYTSILWTMLVKNKMQSLKNHQTPKLQICYSSVNIKMFIDLISSEYSDRIEIKYPIDIASDDIHLISFTTTTVYKDIQIEEIHLDTNTFMKIFYSILTNSKQSINKSKIVAYTLFNVIDFNENNNLEQFGQLDISIQQDFIDKLTDSINEEISVIHLRTLKPYFLKQLHEKLKSLDVQSATFQNLIANYKQNQDAENMSPTNYFIMAPNDVAPLDFEGIANSDFDDSNFDGFDSDNDSI